MLLFSHKTDFGGFLKSSTHLTISKPAIIIIIFLKFFLFSISEEPASCLFIIIFLRYKFPLVYFMETDY